MIDRRFFAGVVAGVVCGAGAVAAIHNAQRVDLPYPAPAWIQADNGDVQRVNGVWCVYGADTYYEALYGDDVVIERDEHGEALNVYTADDVKR